MTHPSVHVYHDVLHTFYTLSIAGETKHINGDLTLDFSMGLHHLCIHFKLAYGFGSNTSPGTDFERYIRYTSAGNIMNFGGDSRHDQVRHAAKQREAWHIA
jgi:hypothetical protein